MAAFMENLGKPVSGCGSPWQFGPCLLRRHVLRVRVALQCAFHARRGQLPPALRAASDRPSVSGLPKRSHHVCVPRDLLPVNWIVPLTYFQCYCSFLFAIEELQAVPQSTARTNGFRTCPTKPKSIQ